MGEIRVVISFAFHNLGSYIVAFCLELLNWPSRPIVRKVLMCVFVLIVDVFSSLMLYYNMS